jgi:hypothetical protein
VVIRGYPRFGSIKIMRFTDRFGSRISRQRFGSVRGSADNGSVRLFSCLEQL